MNIAVFSSEFRFCFNSSLASSSAPGVTFSLQRELGVFSDQLNYCELVNLLFYVEAFNKIIKYFGDSIKSNSLRALSSVLDPKVWTNRSLDHVKKQWRILGESFTNVINIADLPELMSEVSNLKRLGGIEGEEDAEPDTFFAALAGKKDVNDGKEFPLLSKLGSSLCTIQLKEISLS